MTDLKQSFLIHVNMKLSVTVILSWRAANAVVSVTTIPGLTRSQ